MTFFAIIAWGFFTFFMMAYESTASPLLSAGVATIIMLPIALAGWGP